MWFFLGPNPSCLQVGDLIVFIEIDSFLPRTPPFEEFFTDPKYIKQDADGNDGVIIDSIVFGKHLSQGLVLNIDDFPQILNFYQRRIRNKGFTVATRDLESRNFQYMLGVTKWTHPNEYLHEPALEMGSPPAFIVNPVWERIQNIHDLWASPAQQKRLWQVTEKLDGITMRESTPRAPPFRVPSTCLALTVFLRGLQSRPVLDLGFLHPRSAEWVSREHEKRRLPCRCLWS